MNLSDLVRALGLASAYLAVGCDPGAGGDNATRDAQVRNRTCDDLEPTRYRVTGLRIPTQENVTNGEPLGHDVDGLGAVCDTPDYPGDVDNAFVDVAASLPFVADGAGPDLNAELASALACSGEGCTPLVLDVRVGAACDSVELLDGDGRELAAAAPNSDASGERIVARWDQVMLPLALSDRPRCDDGVVCELGASCADGSRCVRRLVDVELSSVTLSANVSPAGLTEIVIGGVLPHSTFMTVIREALPMEVTGVDPDDVFDLVLLRYDVRTGDGSSCDGLSVGLTGSAAAFLGRLGEASGWAPWRPRRGASETKDRSPQRQRSSVRVTHSVRT